MPEGITAGEGITELTLESAGSGWSIEAAAKLTRLTLAAYGYPPYAGDKISVDR